VARSPRRPRRTHSGIKEEVGGPLITLSDPDNVQVELWVFDPTMVPNPSAPPTIGRTESFAQDRVADVPDTGSVSPWAKAF
jgi:hypothetical protein